MRQQQLDVLRQVLHQRWQPQKNIKHKTSWTYVTKCNLPNSSIDRY